MLTATTLMKQYRENGVVACRDISFTARRGEIIAVLGENGSGKSTLMKLISGFIAPDRGSIRLGEREVRFHSPADALRSGIGMVQQHVQLIPAFTVLENLVLGNEPKRFPGRIDVRRAREKLLDIADRYGINPDLQLSAGKLNGVGRQNMSLLYLLSRDAGIIILDEPTTVFDDDEHEYLYRIIRRLTREGRTVLLVTHKIPEALHLADRILVLRDGRSIAFSAPRETSARELSRLIMGEGEESGTAPRDAGKQPQVRSKTGQEGKAEKELLRFEKVSCNRPGSPPVKDLSFTARTGEVHAILGMKESGLMSLEMLLSGETGADRGRIYLGKEEYTALDPVLLRRRRFGLIPSRRIEHGSCIQSTVEENLILLDHRPKKGAGIKPFPLHRFLRYGIRGALSDPLSALSGGNIQKVIIARELEKEPDLLILAEPGKGLDPHARSVLGGQIRDVRNRGGAVLLLTSEMDDALDFADRISILHGGVLTPPMARSELDREKAGMIMLQGRTAEGVR